MRSFVISLLGNAVALWLTTVIVSGVKVEPYAADTFAVIVSYLFVSLIFGVVNSVIGTAIRVIAFPLYLFTLGLISLFVNAVLLLLAEWITSLFGFGLTVTNFWWAVLGAFVLAILNAIVGMFLRPLKKS